MLFRAVLVGLFTLLAVAQVVRTAAVAALAEERKAKVAAFWPAHPDVLRSVAMAGVGAAAASGEEPSAATLGQLRRLAYAQPLALEPLLVQAAIEQKRGRLEAAEPLLLQARRRDPRSEAARFLLADQYIRTGRILPGIAEMSVLGRLVPGAREQVVPALAAYATSAGSAPHLKRILVAYPELEPALLGRLAEDPDNAGLILAIASPVGGEGPSPSWQEVLVRGLVAEGAYARAQSVWARLTGESRAAAGGLFNPGFGASKAPPPFNWSLVSNASGVAEPDSGGLRVLYYGRDDVVLASQLLLLDPGRYRLVMSLSGQAGTDGGIAWRMLCLPADRPLLELPLGGKTGPTAAEFVIPAGCAAQRLELKGEAQEFPQSADFRIGRLELTRIGG